MKKQKVIKKPTLRSEALTFKIKKQSISKYIENYISEKPIDFKKIDQYAEMRLSTVINKLSKKYDKINTYKFAHNKGMSFNRKINNISVNYLVYDEEIGYTAIIIKHRTRGKGKTPKQWSHYLSSKKYSKLIRTEIIESINNSKGHNYFLKDLLFWGADEIHKPKHTHLPKRGNKNVKKKYKRKPR
jgi:hypothetical protein